MEKETPLAVSLEPPATAPAVETPLGTLRTEARVRALGLLFLGLAPVFGLLIMCLLLGDAPRQSRTSLILLAVVLFFLAMLSLFAGVGLRLRQPPARVVAALIAFVPALHFPYGALGTALTLLILYSRTANTVFSKDYRRIAAMEGRPKPLLSWLDTFGLVLLFPLLSVGIMVGVLMRFFWWR